MKIKSFIVPILVILALVSLLLWKPGIVTDQWFVTLAVAIIGFLGLFFGANKNHTIQTTQNTNIQNTTDLIVTQLTNHIPHQIADLKEHITRVDSKFEKLACIKSDSCPQEKAPFDSVQLQRNESAEVVSGGCGKEGAAD